MNEQDVAQIHAALREILLLHLGRHKDVEDLIELLPGTIQESCSEEELYEVVEDYLDDGCEEDGFAVVRDTTRTRNRILMKMPEGCSYAPRDATRIAFTLGGFAEGYSSIDIERTSSGTSLLTQDARWAHGKESTAETTLSESEFERICTALETIGVLGWGSYFDPAILDGTEWGLTIELPDHLAKITSGCNAYPEGFDTLLKTLIDVGLPCEYEDYEGC